MEICEELKGEMLSWMKEGKDECTQKYKVMEKREEWKAHALDKE